MTPSGRKSIAKPINTVKTSTCSNPLYLAVYESPVGRLYLKYDQDAIIESSFKPIQQTAHSQKDQLPKSWYNYITDYFDGNYQQIEKLPYRMVNGTSFQQAIWSSLRDHVRAGRTISYKELAILANRPKAYRAVGQALKSNPLVLIVPCHRVIKQNGNLGGFYGQQQLGQMQKRALLFHEGGLVKSNIIR